ncbi:unnamed protein product [Thlaspi arvense]|uniref:Uncharacterized protein n=1 Tax=Thlaspi arvense TaxID=13288 RepID=A0AAU9SIP7_THLAR|nr:unnamed protein product [Thlaspi arvense]
MMFLFSWLTFVLDIFFLDIFFFDNSGLNIGHEDILPQYLPLLADYKLVPPINNRISSPKSSDLLRHSNSSKKKIKFPVTSLNSGDGANLSTIRYYHIRGKWHFKNWNLKFFKKLF